MSRTRARFPAQSGAAAILLVTLGLSCASQSTIPVIEPPAPPPPSPSAGGWPAPQLATAPIVHEIGRLPEMPMPRFVVSIFALPRGAAGGDAAYSPDSTVAVVNRLELNRISASPLAQAGTLAQDIEKGTAELSAQPAAKAADILIAGSVAPGGNTQVRLFARDTRDGRLAARSEFEGEPTLALEKAVDDAVAQVNRYWFELHRGKYSSVRADARGLRSDAEIGALHREIAAIPGVQLTRHISTAVEAPDTATAGFQVTFDGDPKALAERLTALAKKTGTAISLRN